MAGYARSGLDYDTLYHGTGQLDSADYIRFTGTYYDNAASNKYVRDHDFVKLYWSTLGDNTWRTALSGFNNVEGVLDIFGGDAASMDRHRYSFAVTSPAYGVSDWDLEASYDGGWNTGSFEVQVQASGSSFNLNFRFSSYYNSSNRGHFYAHWRGVHT